MSSPSLRTGQADFPHPALQLVVLPPRGLTGQRIGALQRKEALLVKERNRPAQMIPAAMPSPSVASLAQQATHSHTHPLVHQRERRAVTVFEVRKPSGQAAVQVRDDRRQAVPVSSPGLDSNRVLQLLQALSPRPTQTTFEMVAQKIEAACLRSIHDPGLDRMQRESRRGSPRPHRSSAWRASASLRHKITKSSAYLTISNPAAAIRWSSVSR